MGILITDSSTRWYRLPTRRALRHPADLLAAQGRRGWATWSRRGAWRAQCRRRLKADILDRILLGPHERTFLRPPLETTSPRRTPPTDQRGPLIACSRPYPLPCRPEPLIAPVGQAKAICLLTRASLLKLTPFPSVSVLVTLSLPPFNLTSSSTNPQDERQGREGNQRRQRTRQQPQRLRQQGVPRRRQALCGTSSHLLTSTSLATH